MFQVQQTSNLQVKRPALQDCTPVGSRGRAARLGDPAAELPGSVLPLTCQSLLGMKHWSGPAKADQVERQPPHSLSGCLLIGVVARSVICGSNYVWLSPDL